MKQSNIELLICAEEQGINFIKDIPTSVRKIAPYAGYSIYEAGEHIDLKAAFIEDCSRNAFINTDEVLLSNSYYEKKEDYMINRNLSSLLYADELLEKAFIPCEIKKIGAYAFSGSNIKSVSFPSTLRSIGDYSFYYCNNLDSLELNEGLEKIGAFAFKDCTSLSSVSLPSTLKLVDDGSFMGCEKLKDISIKSPMEYIGNYAFCRCKSLEKIIFPIGIIRIGEGAFRDCTKLKEVCLPSSLRKIESLSFAYCTELETVLISNDTVIEENAFLGCPKVRLRKYPNC